MQYSIIESRILFKPFDDKNDIDSKTKRYGIKVECWFMALVRRILAAIGFAAGIETIQLNGRAIDLNLGSFKRWCHRHGSDWQSHENVIAKIQAIINKREQLEGEKREQEHTRRLKIQQVALDHLNKMATFCYNTEGQLTTDLLRNSWRFEAFNRPTFFPPHDQDPNNSLQAHVQDYVLRSQVFYHGTTPTAAQSIKTLGFNPLAPTKRGNLDSGAGTYLTEDRQKALVYAGTEEKGLLTCRIKPQLKIAHLNDKMSVGINDIKMLTSAYVNKHEKAIRRDLKSSGVDDCSLDSDFNARLEDLFIRDFFLRLGYRGVYTEGSGNAGCSYLNLFDPKGDIVEIT